MSIVAAFMNQTIDYIKEETVDGYGTKTTDNVYQDVPCRWVEKQGVVLTAGNQQKLYRVEVWLLPDVCVEIDYQFVRNDETYKVVTVEDRRDLGGILDHRKVYLA